MNRQPVSPKCCFRTATHHLNNRCCWPHEPTRLHHALKLATLGCHDKFRLDGTPAIWHPLDVMFRLQLHGLHSVDLHCLALLHDFLEDSPDRHNEFLVLISERIGVQMAEWVVVMTDDPVLPNSEVRKAQQLVKLMTAPLEVRLVKLADRLSNLLAGPPQRWHEAKRKAYVSHSLQLVDVVKRSNRGLEDAVLEAAAGAEWQPSDEANQ